MSEPEKFINEWGKEVWKGVELGTPFGLDLFYDVDMSWSSCGDTQKAFHSNLGSITILNRLTGFGHRDVETGYKDEEGRFWLASGSCNVLWSNSKTVGEAIEWVKQNANTCVGGDND
jgi:hypothetical protein